VPRYIDFTCSHCYLLTCPRSSLGLPPGARPSVGTSNSQALFCYINRRDTMKPSPSYYCMCLSGPLLFPLMESRRLGYVPTASRDGRRIKTWDQGSFYTFGQMSSTLLSVLGGRQSDVRSTGHRAANLVYWLVRSVGAVWFRLSYATILGLLLPVSCSSLV